MVSTGTWSKEHYKELGASTLTQTPQIHNVVEQMLHPPPHKTQEAPKCIQCRGERNIRTTLKVPCPPPNRAKLFLWHELVGFNVMASCLCSGLGFRTDLSNIVKEFLRKTVSICYLQITSIYHISIYYQYFNMGPWVQRGNLNRILSLDISPSELLKYWFRNWLSVIWWFRH